MVNLLTRKVMPLTDAFVRTVKPNTKKVRYGDEHGLYLEVCPAEGKSWRYNYYFQGKQQALTIGTYPLVTLKDARELLMEAKRTLKAGINPASQKKILKQPERSDSVNSFEVRAREWFECKKEGKKENYTVRIWGRVEKELFPFLANRPIHEIDAPESLGVLKKVETRGGVDTAHRCLQCCLIIA